MKKYNPTQENRIDLERDIAQLDGIGLAEEPPLCHSCNQPLTDGDRITVYARRAADSAHFELGRMTCSEHQHNQRTQFNTEFRELIVDGCVGWCSDYTRQTAWPILLHPDARVISPVDTTEGYRFSSTQWFRTRIAFSRPDDMARECIWSVSPTIDNDELGEFDTSTTDEGGETSDFH